LTAVAPPGPAAPAIEVTGLSKRFGAVRAVDDLSFTVEGGRITGFLGPNGAGKTTTLRMLLGLVTPDAGRATIGGSRYADLSRPLAMVGAALEASSFHPGRTARNHLRVQCAAAGLPDRRADEVLDLVGLASAGRRAVRGFSMGMRQRLSLAAALLGEPQVLILDEPANGLDPEGINWLRGFLRHLAEQGRTVLVSSHLLSEVQQTVDDVVIIARGRLAMAGPLAELTGKSAVTVRVRTPEPDRLRSVLAGAQLAVRGGDDGALLVADAAPAAVGRLAYEGGIELHELAAERTDLEQVFLQLTAEEGSAG